MQLDQFDVHLRIIEDGKIKEDFNRADLALMIDICEESKIPECYSYYCQAHNTDEVPIPVVLFRCMNCPKSKLYITCHEHREIKNTYPGNKMYFVYFITDGIKTKIGYSIDPSRRIKDLQISNALPLKLLGTVKIRGRNAAKKLEASLHERFKEYRLNGEWFDILPEWLDEFMSKPDNVTKA